MSESRNTDNQKSPDDYWVDRKGRMTLLYRGLWLLCGGLALADFFYAHHPVFKIEEFPVFYGLFGFIVTLGLVLAARELRKIVGRDEDYYDR